MKKSVLLLFGVFLFFYGAKATDITTHFTTNTTLTVANSPYIIVNSVNINDGVTVTVEEGVEIKFNSGRYLQVFGTLNAYGAKFTANGSTAKGFWDGIYVAYDYNNPIGTVQLDSCTVEFASNIYVRKGTLTLRKTTIDNFSSMGVQVYAQGTLNIKETVIKNCNYPVYLNGPGKLNDEGNNVLTGNSNNYVYLYFQDISNNFFTPNMGIPYYIPSHNMRVTETGTLNISAGVNFYFGDSRELNVLGKIKALGTSESPITFDKFPSGSQWIGFNISDSSVDTACVFKYCTFKNAKYDYEWYCAVEIGSASPTFENCTFTDNCRNLNVYGVSKPVFTNCVFNPSTVVSGEAYNLGIDMNVNIDFSTDSIKFNSKEIRAVKILSNRNIIDDGHLKKISFKNINNISYCLYDGATVVDTASLVIDPGVVIKCRNYNSGIWANGTLTAIGTEEEPIIFTSIADDNFGNPKDSQNDGQLGIDNSSSGRIGIYGTSTSQIKNWKIYYGGYNSGNWAVYVSKGNIVEKCEIKNSYRGIYFYDNSQLLNNSFSNINYYPVGRYVNSGTPVLIGNTVANVGYIGIFIPGFANESATLKSYDFAGVTNAAYLIDGDLSISEGKILTVEPGVVVKLYQYGKLNINGALKAIGNKDHKIIFTSYNDDSASGDSNNNGTASTPGNGDWGGFNFNGNSSDVDNVLKNCEVRYCGQWYHGRSAAIQIYDCKVTMDSVLVNFTNVCGLGIFGNANPVITNTQLYNLGNAPVYMDLFSDPTFGTNIKVANLPRIGLLIRGGSVTGTIPVRNFAGYNNITYIVEEELTVPNTKELIIPAGLTFKSNAPWRVRGKLSVQGTSGSPVVFTAQEDDAFGSPSDTQQNGNTTPGNGGNYFVFYDESDDNSQIEYALFRHSATIPVQTNNASPKILNTTFQKIAFEGVSLAGSSAPSINNCTFDNVTFPFRTSLVTYPAETNGNVISGTTGRAIRITDETLTQNVSLLKRAFADKANIPYVFGNYTIGSGAVLTIKPGVVCKFLQNGYLSVYNGLIAKGGNTTDSTIVFTAVTDDFYGGDTYNDGDTNVPGSNYWRSIFFNNESIDENCKLENCIIKNASDIYYYPDYAPYDQYRYGAVALDNASPTIKSCLFDNNYIGITCRNTSLPTITNCDFVGIGDYGKGVWNMTSTNTVTAENCWWNHNTGPYNATSNPTGQGEPVSDYVDFTPWATQLAKPVLGDVSMNGEVKPFDASLVLQHTVASIVLTDKQKGVADVSGNNLISSYDASLILQYSVGIISKFDPEPLGVKSAVSNEYVSITFPSLISEPNKKTFEIPLTVSTFEGVKAVDMKYSINQDHVKFLKINKDNISSGISVEAGFDAKTGEVIIAMASAYDLNLDNQKIVLEFEFAGSDISESMFSMNTLMANDNILANTGNATIIGKSTTTGLGDLSQLSEPVVTVDHEGIHAQFNLSKSNQDLLIQVIDVTGRTLYKRTVNNLNQGMQYIDMSYSDFDKPGKGICILNLKAGDFSLSKKLLIK